MPLDSPLKCGKQTWHSVMRVDVYHKYTGQTGRCVVDCDGSLGRIQRGTRYPPGTPRPLSVSCHNWSRRLRNTAAEAPR